MDNIQQLKQWIDGSDRIVFFGGAGVSTESGIPDFRSVDGLYHQKFKYPPETMLSHTFYETHTAEFFDFYRQKLIVHGAKPNAAPLRLAAMERVGIFWAVVTQNIDGLHQKAGSRKVYEIHGSALRNYCMSCGKRYPEDYIFESNEPIPHCTCGGVIRPDITLYEEMLPDEAVENAVRAISRADLMIIAGTSLTVYPAASFINYFHGKRLVILNRDPLSVHMKAETLVITENMDKVFKALAEKEGIAL